VDVRSAPGLTSSQAGGHLTSTSCSSVCRLRTLPLMAAGSNYIALARISQKTPRPTTLLLLRARLLLLHQCLAMGMLAEPFPSKGYLNWLHNSYVEQICHVAPSIRLLVPSSLPMCRRSFRLRGENIRECPVPFQCPHAS
jgi:hypothetical protein